MPMFEFDCTDCGKAFEELLPMGKTTAACPDCGSKKTQRRFSTFAAHGGGSTPDCPSAGMCPSARMSGGCPGAGGCSLG